jgi:hypothetical protein
VNDVLSRCIIAISLGVLTVAGACKSASTETQEAFLSFDFARTFPHKFWTSNWKTDSTYPEGFRYKVLSARQEPAKIGELVVVLEERRGTESEMIRMTNPLADFDELAAAFVGGLASEHGLDFELVDCSNVHDLTEFHRRVKAAGWHDWTDN